MLFDQPIGFRPLADPPFLVLREAVVVDVIVVEGLDVLLYNETFAPVDASAIALRPYWVGGYYSFLERAPACRRVVVDFEWRQMIVPCPKC